MQQDWMLILAWREGDRLAGDVLIRKYLRIMGNFFGPRAKDHADDLVQKTFVACVEAVGRFEGRSSFRTFLYAIARNILLEHLRENTQQTKLVSLSTTLVGRNTTPTQALARKEEQGQLRQLISQLPVDAQLLVELYYWEELPVGELAIIFEVPEGTIKRRLFEAREILGDGLDRVQPGRRDH